MLTLTPKLHEDPAKKENGRTIYLMIIDEKILNKMQSNVKAKTLHKGSIRFIQNNQLCFIQEMQG